MRRPWRTRHGVIAVLVLAALAVSPSACVDDAGVTSDSASTDTTPGTTTTGSPGTAPPLTVAPITTAATAPGPTAAAATTTATPPGTTAPPMLPDGTTTVGAPPTTPPATTVAPTPVATTPPAPTTVAVPTPPSTGRSTAVHRLPASAQVIALTLDAGSDLGYTDLILDTLGEKGVQASFGITGAFAEAQPERVRRMAREGHVVMNHSQTHFSFTGTSSPDVLLTTEERQTDLLRADAVLSSLTGATTTPYWRPPFGDYDAGVLDDVGAIGYAYTVMWSFDSLGWRGRSADEIVERVLDLAEPGAIVVMHVGSQSQDGPALGRVIDGLRSMGYTFTTVATALQP